MAADSTPSDLMPFERPEFYQTLLWGVQGLPVFHEEGTLTPSGVVYRPVLDVVYHRCIVWPPTGWRRITSIYPANVETYRRVLDLPSVKALGLELMIRPWVQLGELDHMHEGMFALWWNRSAGPGDLTAFWAIYNAQPDVNTAHQRSSRYPDNPTEDSHARS